MKQITIGFMVYNVLIVLPNFANLEKIKYIVH
jgi:hypothetical protein